MDNLLRLTFIKRFVAFLATEYGINRDTGHHKMNCLRRWQLGGFGPAATLMKRLSRLHRASSSVRICKHSEALEGASEGCIRRDSSFVDPARALQFVDPADATSPSRILIHTRNYNLLP